MLGIELRLVRGCFSAYHRAKIAMASRISYSTHFWTNLWTIWLFACLCVRVVLDSKSQQWELLIQSGQNIKKPRTNVVEQDTNNSPFVGRLLVNSIWFGRFRFNSWPIKLNQIGCVLVNARLVLCPWRSVGHPYHFPLSHVSRHVYSFLGRGMAWSS